MNISPRLQNRGRKLSYLIGKYKIYKVNRMHMKTEYLNKEDRASSTIWGAKIEQSHTLMQT